LVCVQSDNLTSSIYLTVVLKLASDFGVVSWAEAILENELLRKDDDKHIYSVKDVATVYEMLTTSESGYLGYADLCHSLGMEKVQALIAQNVIHYRPKSDFARDLVPFPTKPVLTATSAAHRLAMKLVLERLSCRNEKCWQ
jgi:hypothetical protein